MIKVLLLIDCASEHDRKLLRGMMRYSKEQGPWLFYRLSPDFRYGGNREEWALQWAREWKADALIGRWDDRKTDLLRQLDIPVVLQNNRSRSDIFSNLTGDYHSTGKMAAQYFRKKLYTDYAFFGIKDIVWSEERCKGYEEEVKANGGRFYSYMEPEAGDEREKIMEWLMSLPKPVALFCCDDAHALFITETCKIAGIRVPDDIAVLGVDDDELLCDISDPAISSIKMDVENGGYMTCRLLNERIHKRDPRPFNVVIKPLDIKERASTLIYNIKDKRVLDIIRFIDAHYYEDLGMADILSRVPLSRRSIEMKFRQEVGMTIYQYLLGVRVDHLAYLLRTTSLPFSEAVYKVGFRDSVNVARVFRKFKGCSPSEYRNRYCVI